MLKIVGFIVVVVSVLGGYVLAHGELAALWQPFELVIIGGAAVGAFMASNPPNVLKSTLGAIPTVFAGAKYKPADYLEVLSLLYEVFNKWRKDGLMTLETDIEVPEESEIFIRYPKVLLDTAARDFICDYLRIISTGNLSTFELENLMDEEIETHLQEKELPAAAVARTADSLPGFGIVAAVLGIVITMKSLGGPPDELGLHVAAALVGTFLGILMAYGFVGPLGVALEHKAREEMKVFECIKSSILAMVNGIPPQLAVEFGRKTLYSSDRPSFAELEEHLRSR